MYISAIFYGISIAYILNYDTLLMTGFPIVSAFLLYLFTRDITVSLFGGGVVGLTALQFAHAQKSHADKLIVSPNKFVPVDNTVASAAQKPVKRVRFTDPATQGAEGFEEEGLKEGFANMEQFEEEGLEEGFANEDEDEEGFEEEEKEEKKVEKKKAPKKKKKVPPPDNRDRAEFFELGKKYKAPSEEDDKEFHLDAGTTFLNAYKSLKPDQVAAMTKDTQDLMQTQKQLMSTLHTLKPLIKDGKEMMNMFQSYFGAGDPTTS